VSEIGEIYKAYDIMTPELRYVDVSTSIRDAAMRIINEGIGALIVTKEGSPVGIVTKRDIIWAILFEKRSPDDPVEKIMSTPLITVDSDAGIKDVLSIMIRNNISHLPVREKNKLVGIISDADLLEAFQDLLNMFNNMREK